MTALPAAVVAVIVRDRRMLVVQRAAGIRRPGYWTPVSGAVEPGERFAAAVVREAREEVGLTVAPLAEVWRCDTDDGSFRLHWWTAEAAPGPVVPAPAEVASARWITPAAFADLRPTFALHREFFATVLPGLRPELTGGVSGIDVAG